MRNLYRTLAVILLLCLGVACTDLEKKPEKLDWNPILEKYEPGALLSIWVGSPDNIWFVGGEKDASVVLQFDGTSWINHDCGADIFLRWVHGFDDGSVVAVGDGGTIVRYDGVDWETMESGAPGTTFWGVWGSSPDNIYAVGAPWLQGPEDVEAEGDVIVHYDGVAWSRLTLDYLETEREGSSHALYKVWGTSENEVFVVGSDGLALHYDGVDWEDHPIPEFIVGPIWTVHGDKSGKVYAVGGFSVTFLIRWDGSTWTEVELGENPPLLMQGVWVDDTGVYVSGRQGYTAHLSNDGVWTEAESITPYVYHAIRGDGEGGVYACGGDIDALKEDYVGVLSASGTQLPSP